MGGVQRRCVLGGSGPPGGPRRVSVQASEIRNPKDLGREKVCAVEM